MDQQGKAHAKEIIVHMHTIGSSSLPQTINFMTFSTLHIPLSHVQMFDNGVL